MLMSKTIAVVLKAMSERMKFHEKIVVGKVELMELTGEIGVSGGLKSRMQTGCITGGLLSAFRHAVLMLMAAAVVVRSMIQ